jgi:hypothetical protein
MYGYIKKHPLIIGSKDVRYVMNLFPHYLLYV